MATADPPIAPQRPPGGLEAVANEAAFTRFRRRLPPAGLVFGVGWLTALTFMAVFADYLPFIRDYHDQGARRRPHRQRRTAIGPGWTPGSAPTRAAATCSPGASTAPASPSSSAVGATSSASSSAACSAIVAGYFRGLLGPQHLGRSPTALLAFPALVIASCWSIRFDDLQVPLRLARLGRRRVWPITLVLGLLSIAPLARIVRAQTLSLSQREFVLAARSLGAGNRRIIFREILPNLVPAMVTVAFTGLGLLIAAEGGLAFLGYSVERRPRRGAR